MDKRINYVLWSSRSASPILSTPNIKEVYTRILKYKCPNLKVRVQDEIDNKSFDLFTVRKNWIAFHSLEYTNKYIGDPYQDVYCQLIQRPCVISELHGETYYFAVD